MFVIWFVTAIGYLLLRRRNLPNKTDFWIAFALSVFAVSSLFEGDVFWQPYWNLVLKACALLVLAICILKLPKVGEETRTGPNGINKLDTKKDQKGTGNDRR